MARSISSQKIAYWQARVAAPAQPGLTVVDFCKQQECSVGAFYLWKRRLHEMAQDSIASPSAGTSSQKNISNHFIEVIPQRPAANITRTASNSVVEFHLRSGSLVRVPAGDVQLLQVVVESLRSEL